MTKFSHNGIEIELLTSGKFKALINGKPYQGDSLAGVKKKIDNAAKDSFQPFTCLKADHWDKELIEVTVSGVKASRKGSASYRNHHEFILADGNERRSVMENTPENKAAWQAWRAHKDETARIAEQRSEEGEALRDKIKYLSADNFAPKKPTNGGA